MDEHSTSATIDTTFVIHISTKKKKGSDILTKSGTSKKELSPKESITTFSKGNCEIDFCDTLVDFSDFFDKYDQSNATVLDLDPEILSDSDIEIMDSSVEWNPSNGYVAGNSLDRLSYCDSSISARTKSVKCEGFCGKFFHAACQGLSADVVKTIEKRNGLSWKCNPCQSYTSEVHEILDARLSSLVNEIHQLFSSVRSEILEIAVKKISTVELPEINDKKSYSAITKGKSAIIIKPKDATQNTQATKADMLHHVNPVAENLQLSGVKNVKNGGILIGCNSDDDNLKLKKIAAEKLSDKYEIKEVAGFSPRVRVAGMTEKQSAENFINSIKSQNKDVLSEKFECKVIDIKPIKKRVDIFQAILQLDYGTYNKIMSVNKGGLAEIALFCVPRQLDVQDPSCNPPEASLSRPGGIHHQRRRSPFHRHGPRQFNRARCGASSRDDASGSLQHVLRVCALSGLSAGDTVESEKEKEDAATLLLGAVGRRRRWRHAGLQRRSEIRY
ncbi:unnamed protein product [Acanthoscelides obtectus]|uniref:PHD-type domain-containing protein n=1 Tax=Acanthoscelides obtectus TaxID=200917 RepID=A0A9P0M8U6_ACAOB|nr:unnamed protein product [Acanthoscelides obtectus]CAK1650118.1 hypothetical protein AOBTE_LOCUS16610 [Acanthoscelides obtectus]